MVLANTAGPAGHIAAALVGRAVLDIPPPKEVSLPDGAAARYGGKYQLPDGGPVLELEIGAGVITVNGNEQPWLYIGDDVFVDPATQMPL